MGWKLHVLLLIGQQRVGFGIDEHASQHLLRAGRWEQASRDAHLSPVAASSPSQPPPLPPPCPLSTPPLPSQLIHYSARSVRCVSPTTRTRTNTSAPSLPPPHPSPTLARTIAAPFPLPHCKPPLPTFHRLTHSRARLVRCASPRGPARTAQSRTCISPQLPPYVLRVPLTPIPLPHRTPCYPPSLLSYPLPCPLGQVLVRPHAQQPGHHVAAGNAKGISCPKLPTF